MSKKEKVLLIFFSILGICYFGYALWNWLLVLSTKFTGLRGLVESAWTYSAVINSNWYLDIVPVVFLFILSWTIFIFVLLKKTRLSLYLLIWGLFSSGCFFLYDITNQNWQAWESVPQGQGKFHYANWPFFTKSLLNHRWGYIDKNGKFIIKPHFKSASSFSEGYASACIDFGKYGYIDRTGTFVIKPQFWSVYPFSNGLAVFLEQGGKCGVIDQKGNIVLKAIYDQLGPYADGLLPVKIEDKFGYLNASGKIVIEPIFERANPFSEGLAAVVMNNKWGYIGVTGKFTIDPQYQDAREFSGGLACVQKNYKFGLINKTGQFVIEPEYYAVFKFYNGSRWLMKNKKYIQVDADGNILRKMDNDHIARSREGMTLDYKNGRAGFLDEAGNLKIPHKYNIAFDFNEGLAAVSVLKFALPRWLTYFLIICSGFILKKLILKNQRASRAIKIQDADSGSS